MPTPLATFPGITSTQSACGCLPPDTDGDVGPSHYIQAVNSRIKIIDKAGTELLAPTTYNSFFNALGPTTPCGNQNRGDGFVFYDHLADRWVVSDFAFPAFPGTSFYQCIGVSKTSDPVAGGWWLYALQVDPANPTFLGDYPKFGLWPDAYYFSVNLFSNNTTFNGVRVYALPRRDDQRNRRAKPWRGRLYYSSGRSGRFVQPGARDLPDWDRPAGRNSRIFHGDQQFRGLRYSRNPGLHLALSRRFCHAGQLHFRPWRQPHAKRLDHGQRLCGRFREPAAEILRRTEQPALPSALTLWATR